VIRSNALFCDRAYPVAMKDQTGTAQSKSVTGSTTIEVMLTPQQLGDLANGSNAASQQRKWRPSRAVVGAAVAAALVVAGSIAHLAAKPSRAPPVLIKTSPEPPPPLEEPPPAPVAREPVLLKNPFDRNEVFEFPPGTTEAEARDAVAKVLFERAQSRGPDVLKLRYRKTHTR
jgi:hypothetical protein